MHLSGLDFVFWVCAFAGHLALFCVLSYRHRIRRYPFFSALIVSSIARTVILYEVYRFGTAQTYYIWYWLLAILDTALQFGVLYEVASIVFRPAGPWARDVQRSWLWLISGAVLVASFLTWLAAPAASVWQQMLVAKGSFFFAVLMSELLVGMVSLSITAGLPWKTHAARIAQGLGTYSLIDILIEAAHTLFGKAYASHTDITLSHLRVAVYLGCLLYWLVTLWLETPPPQALPFWMSDMLPRLQTRTAADVALVRRVEK